MIDDLVSVNPWRARMLEIRGRAETLYEGGASLGPGFADEMIRIHPTRIAAFGLDPNQTHIVARKIKQQD